MLATNTLIPVFILPPEGEFPEEIADGWVFSLSDLGLPLLEKNSLNALQSGHTFGVLCLSQPVFVRWLYLFFMKTGN